MEEVKNMKSVSTPAAEYFFMVNPKAKILDADKSDVFHTKITKELFLCNRGIPNIQPTVPFLFTIIKVPDEDGWKFLLIMIKYIQET